MAEGSRASPAPRQGVRPSNVDCSPASEWPHSPGHAQRSGRHPIVVAPQVPPRRGGPVRGRLRHPGRGRPALLGHGPRGRGGDAPAGGPSSARTPACACGSSSLPWSAAHEKLLTAFAGDATPDLAQMGNTWLPEFVALGRWSRWTRACRGVRRRSTWPTTTPASGTPTWSRAGSYGVPWYVDTRVLFYRRDLLARGGLRRARRATGASGCACWRTIKRRVRPGALRAAAAAQRVRAAGGALRCSRASRCCATAAAAATSAARASAARWSFYLSMYERQPGAAGRRTARSPTSGTSSPAATSASTSRGPWQHRRVQAPPAGRAAVGLDDGAAARPRRPGRLDRRRVEPGASSGARRARPRPGSWCEYLSRPEVQQRSTALTGNLPPRRSAWADPALRRRRARAGLPRPARTRARRCRRCRSGSASPPSCGW